MNVTKDVQETIIAALIKNSYLFSICRDEMTDGYFQDPSCKIIYKSLTTYYKKYKSMPDFNALLISIEESYYPTCGVDLSVVKDTCQRLFTYPEPDEQFIKDKITDFIRKVKSSAALRNFIDQVKQNPNLESDSVVSDLVKALEVSLSSTRVFMMSDPDQVKAARQSAVGSADQSKVIHSFVPSLNSHLMFGGWQPSTVNMICYPPGRGKSMYLINEGISAIKQGFDVLHIFIGDMVEYDGFIRYLACASSTPMNSLVMMPQDKQMEVVKLCNDQHNNLFDHLFILAYPSLSINVDTLMEDIFRFEKHLKKDFGMIIVDYPDNLVQEGAGLYQDGGTLYSSLERLARLSQSVVLVASQPQKFYWNHEIIPLEAASESSKKQMAVDVMLTGNLSSSGSSVGSWYLAKARKGEVGKVFRFKTDYARCKVEEIDESTYQTIKSSEGVVK